METSATHQIVILGGGYAGLMAALRLSNNQSTRKSITLIDGRPHFSERIRFHQLGNGYNPQPIDYESFLHRRPIQFIQGWVTALNADEQIITLHAADGQERTIPYDQLIYALGSGTDEHTVPGIKRFAHTLKSAESAQQLHRQVAALSAGDRVLICGGGLTGIELATEIAESTAVRVDLITRSGLGEDLSPAGADHIRGTFQRLGIGLIEDETVCQITPTGIQTVSGRTFASDLVIWTGAFAAPPLARNAGLTVNERGQIVVDDHLQSVSHKRVYAVGDAATVTVAEGNRPLRMACATALPMGAYIGQLLAKPVGEQAAANPFNFNYLLRCISLGRGDALVQFVDADDKPQDRIFTGRLAAWIKELICRYTIWSLRTEKWRAGSYRWPQKA